MQKKMEQTVADTLAKNHRRRTWKTVVSILACIVVFCTTYALILPAITLENHTVYCGLETHQHDSECYEKTLICGQKETNDSVCDDNTDDCYFAEETLESGLDESETIPGHKHTDECYEYVLTCGKEEHTHELSCYSNPKADVESQEEWQDSVSCVKLTGNWHTDLIAVAESQLGYTESDKNYAVDEDGETINGYTRYGAWYGTPYGDWDTLYVSFCLYYAGLPEEVFPTEVSCQQWVEKLKSKEYGLYAAATNGYEPLAGDLVYFDRDGDGVSDHVGLAVERITDKEGSLTKIKTIEGDAGNQVKYVTYSIDDETVLGYGILPDNSYMNNASEYAIMPTAEYGDSTHPQGAITGDFDVFGVNLYSINTSNGEASALAGVTYTVYQDDKVIGTYTTNGTDYSLALGNDGLNSDADDPGRLAPGTYTVEQTDVPDGYIVVPQKKEFTVENGKWNTAGTFYVYNAADYDLSKTAQVTDYENRIYEEVLTGKSGGYNAEIQPGNFIFAVDRSNSMLFPTSLTPVKTKSGSNLTVNFGSSSNDSLMNFAINFFAALPNDDDGLYYIVNDPTGTATVYAVWKVSNRWYYQDASYYAKAQMELGENYADQGGKGGLLSEASFNGTYTIYKGSPYTRLTWLKYDLSLMVYQLAALNPDNVITVTSFDSDVERCVTQTLDEDGVNDLINAIRNIATDGGTAQDKALLHLVNKYYPTGKSNVECYPSTNHLSNTKNYVILITDGALNSTTNINGLTPEQNVRESAEQIRANAQLMTIGLSMDDVEFGQKLLADVNAGGIASPGLAFLDKNAKEIASTIQNNIWGDLVQLTPKESRATVTDHISDSFYLVTRDGKALAEGDWLTLNGSLTASGEANAAGKVCRDSNGWYIEWENQALPTDGSLWQGKLYVKAKEDFIGGNGIDVNKSAKLEFLDTDGSTVTATLTLPTPTVNVRLLPMADFEGEATLFLGDPVNRDTDGNGIPDVMEDLTGRVDFKKLIPSAGDVYNRNGAAQEDGCGENAFTVSYATGGKLTKEEWKKLKDGETVTFPYTYDNDSSHGPVGYFTLSLEVTSTECQECGQHFCGHVGKGVLSYALHMTYTAYRLGGGPENGTMRPDENVYNGNEGPGTEIGSIDTADLTKGCGTVEATVSYTVNVVDGQIVVTKELEEAAKEDTAFTFYLYKQETVDNEVVQTPYAKGTILIPKGSTDGTETHVYFYNEENSTYTEASEMPSTDGELVFRQLERGSYLVAEDADPVYAVKSAAIVQNGTNCPSTLSTAKTSATFHIGFHPVTDGEADNIVYQTGYTEDGHHIIYSYEWQHIQPDTPITEFNGESYGEVHFVNTVQTEEKELPVQKLWDESTGGAAAHNNDTVYVVLCYENGIPVLTDDDKAQLLKLDSSNEWHGQFNVIISMTEEFQGYTVREVSGVKSTYDEGLQPAVVINDSQNTVYYEFAAGDRQLVEVGGKGYVVTYGGDLTNGLTVMNAKQYALPQTGGAGTAHMYFIGVLLMTLAVGYGCKLRRGCERRII